MGHTLKRQSGGWGSRRREISSHGAPARPQPAALPANPASALPPTTAPGPTGVKRQYWKTPREVEASRIVLSRMEGLGSRSENRPSPGDGRVPSSPREVYQKPLGPLLCPVWVQVLYSGGQQFTAAALSGPSLSCPRFPGKLSIHPPPQRWLPSHGRRRRLSVGPYGINLRPLFP